MFHIFIELLLFSLGEAVTYFVAHKNFDQLHKTQRHIGAQKIQFCQKYNPEITGTPS